MKNRFWPSVGSVFSGTMLAQAVPILGSLALTRLYAPSAFGIYSVWVGVVLILGVMVTLRLEMSLVIVEDGGPRQESAQLLFVTVLLVGSMASILLATFWVLGLIPQKIVSPPLFASALLGMAMTAFSNSWQIWASAEGNYRSLVWMRLTQALALVGSQIGAASLFQTAEALVVGHLVGLAAALSVAAWQMPLSLPQISGLHGRLYAFWTSNSRFPVFSLPADSISMLSAQLPLLVISARFGAEAAGFLALTMRVLGAPIALLGRSILDVFRRYASESYRREGNCAAVYVSTFRVLFFAALVLVIAIVALGRTVFDMLFGPLWVMSGMMAMWLVPLFAMRFVASPLSYVFYIAGKQKADLIWQIFLFAFVSMSLLIPNSLDITLITYSLSYTSMYVLYLGFSYHYSKGQHT